MDATEYGKLASARFVRAAANSVGTAASNTTAGRGGVLSFLLGQGHLNDVPAPKRIVDAWGGVDNAVIDARSGLGMFERAGVKVDPSLQDPLGGATVRTSQVVNEALPRGAIMEHFQTRKLLNDAAARKPHLDALRERGLRVSDAQYVAALRNANTVGSHLRATADAFVGHKPLETIRQRFIQGGLVGKGGVLTSDLVPDADLRRGAAQTWSHLRKGEYGSAVKSAPLGMGAMYAANLYYGYGGPLHETRDALAHARATGEDPTKDIASAVLRGAASNALAPTNLGYMWLGPKVDAAIDGAVGRTPKAYYQTTPELGAQPNARTNAQYGPPTNYPDY